ncbi:MBL fold metallo-hydrolase [Paraconexibacter antarcticus]|uniref:MBL fold metallo-hydrolase n=1 Tax=Paraconexibacter antarcticus TaxID=2949664 RepID=A0ABY5DZD5_9ACTN|nr:MBL fold metallo-hydrolase [Paraconexibacter antarcticus]UTI66314.1 MBL fold metallo-hydrolase [Paraconexibacter antarcticus]
MTPGPLDGLGTVARIPGHLASLARFVAERQDRRRADADAFAELARRPLHLPAGVELEWLGTAGYRLTAEGQTLYIDPYVSRVPPRALLGRRPALADPLLHARFLTPPGPVAGVLVGHTHFDHAIDVPELCRRTGATAYGSASLGRLMHAFGVGDRAVQVVPRQAYELGPFVVRFHRSAHSKLLLGLKVPSDGELTCDHIDGFNTGAYRCGQVFGIEIEVAGLRLYHQGSANLLDDEVPTGGVDVFLAGIAGRRFTPGYWPRILGRLQPDVVVASHFDDFLRPVDAPTGFSLNVNLAVWPEEIAAVGRDIGVAALPAPVSGGPRAPASGGTRPT